MRKDNFIISDSVLDNALTLAVKEIFNWYNGNTEEFPKREISQYYSLFDNVEKEQDGDNSVVENILRSCLHFMKKDDMNTLKEQLSDISKI